jgi:hypothetical protein
MSTWLRPYTGSDYDDVHEYDFSQDGPYLCMDGGSEFACACRRYSGCEIDDEVINRLIFMTKNLKRDKPPHHDNIEKFKKWLKENKGEKIRFRYE